MKVDLLPENLVMKWWEAARDDYAKKPLETLKDYQLEALCWYYERLMDGWEHESPQSYQEALLWHQENVQLAQAQFEKSKRNASRAERWLADWQAKCTAKSELL